MKSKASILMVSLIALSSFAYAQNETKTSFGILGGVNLQNLSGKDSDGDRLENDLIVGYHVGFNIQIPVAPDFYFQPGLIFSAKGGANTTLDITSTYRLSYIELPLNLLYKSQVGSGHILLGFGPYVGYAIGGKAKYEGGDLSLEQDIEFQNEFNNDDPEGAYFSAFDAGGNIFFGYELAAGLFFHLNTQLGMININAENEGDTDDKTAIKNTGFGLSLGFRF